MNVQREASAGPRFFGVASAKGGIGQSSVSLDWARTLSSQGERTLLLEIAGGDLAWMAGTTPTHFTEDVATGVVTWDAAVVPVGGALDLLATGNQWSVYGSNEHELHARLIGQIVRGPWSHCVIDLGQTCPDAGHPAWSACEIIAVVLTDDLACVSRTYVLVRHLLESGWADRIGLVFNQLNDPAQVESLRQRFNQITQTFLGRTLPLIGVVPNASAAKRAVALAKWVPVANGPRLGTPDISRRIIKPAFAADRET